MIPRKTTVAVMLSGVMLLNSVPSLSVWAADAAEEIMMDAVITLNGDSAAAEGQNVTVSGSKITISASGYYEFSGTLTDGQIIVDVPDEVIDPGTVRLYFNGVDITGVSEAPLYVVNAENTTVSLMDGTKNYLRDGGLYTETSAVIYAKDDITLRASGTAGDGKLTVESLYQHGVHCNNDVKITGGNIKIRTDEGDGDGIRGKTSVQIKGGKLDVNASGDGIKSTKGDVLISGGATEVKAGNDAVQGETSVQISGGTLKANGDRGLTNANTAAGNVIDITGGEILATATDWQVVAVNATQPVVMFHTAEQQVKDQAIALYPAGSESSAFEMIPDKKFDYVLISSPELTVGSEYDLYIDGAAVENSTFTVAEGITTLEDVVCSALLRGDPNGDRDVDVVDAIIALNAYIAESVAQLPSPLNAREYAAADVDFNGIVEIEDAMYVLNYYTLSIAGLEPDWDVLITSMGS